MVNLDAIKRQLCRVWHCLCLIARSITVEPPMILLCIGFVIPGQTFVTILYRKICQMNYSDSVNCYELSAYPAIQDQVQEESSTWALAADGVKTFVSLPTILLWSAWADHKRDRIVVILIPLVGFTVLLMIYLLEAVIPAMPIWFIVLGNGLASCAGGIFLMINSVNAYLADRFKDKKWLAVRLALILACVQVGMVIGSEIDSLLTHLQVGIPWIIVLGMALTLVAQLYLALFIRNPIDVVELVDEVDGFGGEVGGEGKPAGKSQAGQEIIPAMGDPRGSPVAATLHKSVLHSTLQLLKDAYHTFSRPRPGYRRSFILMIVVATFLAGVSDDGTDNSKNLFLYRRPLNYTFPEYSQFVGGSAAIVLVGTVSAAVTTKLLGWRDTSLGIMSLVLNIVANLLFAFSRTRRMVWMSCVANCVSFLWGAALVSTIIQLGEPTEQATLIAGTGVAGSLANFLSSLMFNAVYASTESRWPWAAWVAASGLILIGLVLVVVVHIGLKTEPGTSSASPIDDLQYGGVGDLNDTGSESGFVSSASGSREPIVGADFEGV